MKTTNDNAVSNLTIYYKTSDDSDYSYTSMTNKDSSIKINLPGGKTTIYAYQSRTNYIDSNEAIETATMDNVFYVDPDNSKSLAYGGSKSTAPIGNLQTALNLIKSKSNNSSTDYSWTIKLASNAVATDNDISDNSFINISKGSAKSLSITIESDKTSEKRTINANKKGRVINSNSVNLTLKNLNITGGDTYNTRKNGGGIAIAHGSLKIDSCNIYDNTSIRGAGIYTAFVSPEIKNSKIYKNSAKINNEGGGGGGGGIFFASNNTYPDLQLTLTLDNSIIGSSDGKKENANTAETYGGAIYGTVGSGFDNPKTFKIIIKNGSYIGKSNSTASLDSYSNCSDQAIGGGGLFFDSGKYEITLDSTSYIQGNYPNAISNNTTTSISGGGTISNNFANVNGSIINRGGALTLKSITIKENYGSQPSNPEVKIAQGSAVIENVTFGGNIKKSNSLYVSAKTTISGTTTNTVSCPAIFTTDSLLDSTSNPSKPFYITLDSFNDGFKLANGNLTSVDNFKLVNSSFGLLKTGYIYEKTKHVVGSVDASGTTSQLQQIINAQKDITGAMKGIIIFDKDITEAANDYKAIYTKDVYVYKTTALFSTTYSTSYTVYGNGHTYNANRSNTYPGNAMAVEQGVTLSLNDITVKGGYLNQGYNADNNSDKFGAGLHIHQSTVTLNANTCIGNNIDELPSGTHPNYSRAGGAGVYVSYLGNLIMEKGSSVKQNYLDSNPADIGNYKTSYGAGIYIDENGSVTMKNGSSVSYNMGVCSGAGIYCKGTLTFSGTVSHNKSSYTPGIQLADGALFNSYKIENTTPSINDNISTYKSDNPIPIGLGIHISKGSKLRDSEFSELSISNDKTKDYYYDMAALEATFNKQTTGIFYGWFLSSNIDLILNATTGANQSGESPVEISKIENGQIKNIKKTYAKLE